MTTPTHDKLVKCFIDYCNSQLKFNSDGFDADANTAVKAIKQLKELLPARHNEIAIELNNRRKERKNKR